MGTDTAEFDHNRATTVLLQAGFQPAEAEYVLSSADLGPGVSRPATGTTSPYLEGEGAGDDIFRRHPLLRSVIDGAEATLALLACEQGWPEEELALRRTCMEKSLCRELKAARVERCMGRHRAAWFCRDHLCILAAEPAAVVVEVGRRVYEQCSKPKNVDALQALVTKVREDLALPRPEPGAATPDKIVEEEDSDGHATAIQQALAQIGDGVQRLSALLGLPLRPLLVPAGWMLPHLSPGLEQKLARAGRPESPHRIPCGQQDVCRCGPLNWLARLRHELRRLQDLVPPDARSILLFPL